MSEPAADAEPSKPQKFASGQDAATIQANERTLLAWIRTGLSLTTFGFVIARLGVWIHIAGDAGQGIPGARWIGGLFVLLGAVLDAIGLGRYMLFHRAFLKRQPFPTGVGWVLMIAFAVTSLGAILGVFVILSLSR